MNILIIIFILNLNKKTKYTENYIKNLKNNLEFELKNITINNNGTDFRNNILEDNIEKINEQIYKKYYIDFLLNKSIDINYKVEFINNFNKLKNGVLFNGYEDFI